MFFSRIKVTSNVKQLHCLIHGNSYGIHQLLWDLFPGEKKRPFIFREEIAKEQLGVRSDAKGAPIFYIVSKDKPAEDTSIFTVSWKEYCPKFEVGEQLAFKLRANPDQLEKRARSNSELKTWCAKREAKGLKQKAPTKKRVRHDVVMDSQRKLLLELSALLEIQGVCKKSEMKEQVMQAWKQLDNKVVEQKLQTVLGENERFKDRLKQKRNPHELLDLALKANADKALEKWFLSKGGKKGFELVTDEKRGRMKFQAEGYRWHPLPSKGKSAGFSSVDFEGILRVSDTALFKETLFNGLGRSKAFGCGLMMVRRI